MIEAKNEQPITTETCTRYLDEEEDREMDLSQWKQPQEEAKSGIDTLRRLLTPKENGNPVYQRHEIDKRVIYLGKWYPDRFVSDHEPATEDRVNSIRTMCSKILTISYTNSSGRTYFDVLNREKPEKHYLGRQQPLGYNDVFQYNAVSVTNLTEKVRHATSAFLYHDIDIENCHPVIFNFIYTLLFGNESKYISDYINRRQHHLETIQTQFGVARKLAKQLFIRICYGGSYQSWVSDLENDYGVELDEEHEEPKICKGMVREITSIQKGLRDHFQELWNWIPKDSKKSAKQQKNSHLSYFTQEIEKKLLNFMAEKSEHMFGISPCVFSFDGFMVYREDVHDMDSYLRFLEDQVYREWGITHFKMTNKEMERPKWVEDLMKWHGFFDRVFQPTRMNLLQHSKASEALKNMSDEEKEGVYRHFEFQQAYIEQWYFYIQNPFTFCCHDGEKLTRMSKQSFRDSMEKFGSFLRWYLNQEGRWYHKIDFLPPPMDTGHMPVYNLFQGFKASTIPKPVNEPTYLDRIKEHIRVLTNYDEASASYLTGYLGHMFKNPGELPKTALGFISNQGAGKGSFFGAITQNFIGENYRWHNGIEGLTGRFADNSGALMVVTDEVNGIDAHKVVDKTQFLITEPFIQQETKNVQPVDVRNFGRYLFFSNNDNPLKVDPNDRRFVIFRCSDDKAKDTEYFEQLLYALNHPPTIREAYDYFIENAWTRVDLMRNRPMTEQYRDMQKLNQPVRVQFAEWLNEEHKEAETQQRTVEYNARDFYRDFQTFQKEYGLNYPWNPTKFGVEMKKLSSIGITKTHTSNGNKYRVDLTKLSEFFDTE